MVNRISVYVNNDISQIFLIINMFALEIFDKQRPDSVVFFVEIFGVSIK